MKSENTEFTYVPGACNIDAKGTQFRKRLYYISLVAGVIAIVAMYMTGFPMIYRVIISAGFGFAASLNYFQARDHFCVMNATSRTIETGLKRSKIADDLYKDLDLKKRNKMMVKTLVITVLSAALGLLPI